MPPLPSTVRLVLRGLGVAVYRGRTLLGTVTEQRQPAWFATLPQRDQERIILVLTLVRLDYEDPITDAGLILDSEAILARYAAFLHDQRLVAAITTDALDQIERHAAAIHRSAVLIMDRVSRCGVVVIEPDPSDDDGMVAIPLPPPVGP
jgi:hypothetical protein